MGCNHGSDDILPFLKEYEQYIDRAIYIDASIDSLNMCKRTLSRFSNVEFYHYAITDDPTVEFAKLYYPKDDPISGFASLSSNHVTGHKHPDQDSVMVPAITINKLFDTLFESSFIERLYIDIEGWDAKILLDLDLTKYKIPYIMFEHAHLDGPFQQGSLAQQLVNKLRDHKYQLHRRCEYNTIAIK